MGIATSGIIRAEGVNVTSAQSTDLVVIQRVDGTTGQYTPRTITAQNLVETMPLGLTAGAVVFGGSNGEISQDATNFIFNDSTNVLTVGSGVTVTAGPVALTNGNLTLGTAGNGIQIKQGTNARLGTATLASGTVTVSNTSVTTNTRIFLTRANINGSTAIGSLAVGTVTANTSFVINALASNATVATGDTSIVNWLLIEST